MAQKKPYRPPVHYKIYTLVIRFTIIILLISLLVQVFYWLRVFKPLSENKRTDRAEQLSSHTPVVNLVICTNRLHPNFSKLLQCLIDQVDIFIKLIVVDSSNNDHVKSVTKSSLAQASNISLNYINSHGMTTGKKQQLALALQQCDNNPVLLTDDDCIPTSNYWALSMWQKLNAGNDIVLGVSPVLRNRKGLLSLWTHFESIMTAIQYLAFAKKKMPYMGVGRNLIYGASVLNAGILETHADLLSGDDDLSVNQLSKTHKVDINVDKVSFVLTFGPENWHAYYRQKVRHFSTAHKYRLKHQALLSGYSLSLILFYTSLLFLFIQNYYVAAIVCYLFKMISGLIVFNKLKTLLNAEITWLEFIVLDFLLFIYFVLFAIPVLIPQKHKW